MIEVPNFYDLKDISNEWEDNAAKIIKIMKNNHTDPKRKKILNKL